MKIKNIFDMTLDELLKRKKIEKAYNIVCIIFGTLYLGSGYYFYITSGVIGLPIMLYITGISLLFLSVMPSRIDWLIYMKKEKDNK